jgi:hypothetical protein
VWRLLYAAAVVATSLLPAQAGASPSCPLVRDARGDVTAYGTGARVVEGDSSVDLLSADIASSRTKIAAVFRVAALSNSAFPAAAAPLTARRYRLSFPAEGGTWWFEANLDGASPPRPVSGFVGFGDLGVSNSVPGWVTVDSAHSAVRVTAVLADLKVLGRLPRTAGPFQVQADRQVRASYVSLDALVDSAEAQSYYRLGRPSCIQP